MIKATNIATALMSIILMSSFSKKDTIDFIGTYSVSSSDPSQIKLTINTGHTFEYQDFSDVDRKIVVKGEWTQKGQKVILKSQSSDEKFHNVWSFDKNGQVAKSRKGLSYYKLCKIEG